MLRNHIPINIKNGNTDVYIYSFNSETKEVKIKINDGKDIYFDILTLINDDITLFNETLKLRYNISLPENILKGLELSLKVFDTCKINGLIQAGFKSIYINNSKTNYNVDNIFEQNFMSNEEVQYLIKNNIENIELKNLL